MNAPASGDGAAREAWPLAHRAAELLAIDPQRLGGAVLRTAPSPVSERWLVFLRSLLPAEAPWRKLPAHAATARLVGGLDLAASLSAGRPLFERGLLAEADGGAIVAPMAERLEPETAAILSAALDEKIVRAERDGFSRSEPARFALLLIDEGASADETVSPRLVDRLAFALDLDRIAIGDAKDASAGRAEIERAATRLPDTNVPDRLIEALGVAALRSGVMSIRALQFAVAAARASAALAGRREAGAEDAALAAALVIAPRALYAPADPDDAAAEAPPEAGEAPDSAESQSGDGPLEDRIVAAMKAAIDSSLLAGGAAQRARSGRAQSTGKSGAARKSQAKGRPFGSRRGDPSRGGRLALIDTLRAAAPWQKIRGRMDAAQPIAIRRDDLRVARFRRREQSLTIFVVDASGSAAMQRLGETKGAIEHLFARSYSRRDEVALIAFRKSGAEVLVPPTRSLVRARRLLADLPGGGGTPIAAGIDTAAALAIQSAARGRTPTIVLMSDGRANVALSGEGGREAAQADALSAARRLRGAGMRVLFFDTSMRPEPLASALAAEMGAAYYPLPHADARLVAAAVASSRPALR